MDINSKNPMLMKPTPYIPSMPTSPAYGKEVEGNKTTARGKQFLSNRYNFLLEVMKFIPRFEAEVYKMGEQRDNNGTLMIDEKWQKEFGTETLRDFGFTHSQGEASTAPVAIFGTGSGTAHKDFSFTPAFYDFNHTNDGVNQANFFISKREYDGDELQKSTIYDDGNINDNPIPVYSSPESDGSNVYLGDGMTRQQLKNYFPTDYNSLFFGLNPAMLTNKSELPNITSYDSSILQAAQNYFKNGNKIYTYNKFNGDVNDSPSFYQIAMDPKAPWNNNGAIQPGTWYVGKNEGELAYNFAILFLEARRRYFAAMTQLIGPHRQFESFIYRTSSLGYVNYDMNETEHEKALDTLMMDLQDRFLGTGFDVNKMESIGNWTAKESGTTNKTLLRLFVIAQHRLSQAVDKMSEGIGLSLHWSGKDATQMINFRKWMLEKLQTYRDTFKSSVAGSYSKPDLPDVLITQKTQKIKVPKGNSPPASPNSIPGETILSDTISRSEPEGKTEGSGDSKKEYEVYTFTFKKYRNSDWDTLKANVAGSASSIPSTNSVQLPSYKFLKYSDAIRNVNSRYNVMPTTAAALNTATSAIAEAVNGLGSEITNIKSGYSYDQLVYESFYQPSSAGIEVKTYDTPQDDISESYGTTVHPDKGVVYKGVQLPAANYELQPTGGAAGYNKNSGNEAVSWDRTYGHMVGADRTTSKPQPGHPYSPASALLYQNPVFFRVKEVYLDDDGKNFMRGSPYKNYPIDKMWVTHFYGTLTENFMTSELVRAMKADLDNKTRKAQFKRKMEQYKEMKDQDFYEQIQEVKNDRKKQAETKRQKNELIKAVKASVQKRMSERKQSDARASKKLKGR